MSEKKIDPKNPSTAETVEADKSPAEDTRTTQRAAGRQVQRAAGRHTQRGLTV